MTKPLVLKLTIPIETELDIVINEAVKVPDWLPPLDTKCPVCTEVFEKGNIIIAANTPVGTLYFHLECLRTLINEDTV